MASAIEGRRGINRISVRVAARMRERDARVDAKDAKREFIECVRLRYAVTKIPYYKQFFVAVRGSLFPERFLVMFLLAPSI